MPLPLFFCIDRSRVVHECVEGEVIIINLETGIYYSLNKSASDIWPLLQEKCSPEILTAAITSRYACDEDQADVALRAFLEDLLQEGLIMPIPDAPMKSGISGPAPPANERSPFQPPALEKYTDMQEFLLVDPIHEVDERGWPHQKDR